MRKLHAFGPYERAQAWLLRDILEKEGIACLLRNEELFAAMGEVPFLECRPELWVVDDEVWPRAKMLFENWLAAGADEQEGWICPACSEQIEGQFGACWRCGRTRD